MTDETKQAGRMKQAPNATVDIHGDVLEVVWNGNVWVTSVGAQYAGRDTAMRDELETYFQSCGEDLDDPDIQQQIEDRLGEIVEA